MADRGAGTPERILIVRLGSMGDIVHTLPAAGALRDAFPRARLDWLVERKWLALLHGNPDIAEGVALERGSWPALGRLVARLRAAKYDCAVDFQGLYKSSVLAFLSGAPRRVGLAAESARESGAALFYTDKVAPAATHIVERNLELAQHLGARSAARRFPLQMMPEAETYLALQLAQAKIETYYVLCPGGGWRSKCWPAEQYGHLHRKLWERHGWRGVVSFGPGERALAESVRLVAGDPEPVIIALDVPQLMAALRGAKFVVAADTGPLHLAAAMGMPVIGLYGPTDPVRNGPYGALEWVVRNAGADETTYRRGSEYSPSMLSIQVDQVVAAIERRLGMAS